MSTLVAVRHDFSGMPDAFDVLQEAVIHLRLSAFIERVHAVARSAEDAWEGEESEITKAMNRSLAANPEGSKLPPVIARAQSATIRRHANE